MGKNLSHIHQPCLCKTTSNKHGRPRNLPFPAPYLRRSPNPPRLSADGTREGLLSGSGQWYFTAHQPLNLSSTRPPSRRGACAVPLACSKEYGTRGTYLVASRAGGGLGPSAGADGAGLDQVTGAEECADIFLTSWTGDSRIIIQPPQPIFIEGIRGGGGVGCFDRRRSWRGFI